MESVRLRHLQCTHAPEFQVTRSNQYAYQLVCATSTGGCGAILQYLPIARAHALRAKGQASSGKTKGFRSLEERAEDMATVGKTPGTPDDCCPRCSRELKPCVTEIGDTILKCAGWHIAGKSRCTFTKARPGEHLRCGQAAPTKPSARTDQSRAPSSAPRQSSSKRTAPAASDSAPGSGAAGSGTSAK